MALAEHGQRMVSLSPLISFSSLLNEMATTSSIPKTNEAVKLTTQTINTRTVRFRNFVIAVVVVALGSVVWASIQWSWKPLLGLLLLVPLCGAFLYLDARLVHQWRQQVLEMWAQENLDLKTFSSAMSTIRTLPERTLRGMLDTLPNPQNMSKNGNLAPADRKALVLSLQTSSRQQNNRTLLTTITYTLGLATLALVAIQGFVQPLVVLPLILLAIGVTKWLNEFRFRNRKIQIHEIAQGFKKFPTDEKAANG